MGYPLKVGPNLWVAATFHHLISLISLIALSPCLVPRNENRTASRNGIGLNGTGSRNGFGSTQFHLICLVRSVEVGNGKYLMFSHGLGVGFKVLSFPTTRPLKCDSTDQKLEARQRDHSRHSYFVISEWYPHSTDVELHSGFGFWVLNHAFFIAGKRPILPVLPISITLFTCFTHREDFCLLLLHMVSWQQVLRCKHKRNSNQKTVYTYEHLWIMSHCWDQVPSKAILV